MKPTKEEIMKGFMAAMDDAYGFSDGYQFKKSVLDYVSTSLDTFGQMRYREGLRDAVEAIKKAPSEIKCGMTCVKCDMDEGWEDWCDCLCHQDNSILDVAIEALNKLKK